MVSEIGFGGWGIGKSWWGPTEDHTSLEALRTAFEGSVNFFDTATVYGEGHSEGLIAKVFQGQGLQVGHTDQAFVATKVPPKNMGWPANPATPISEAFPTDWVITSTERSLKKLGTDCVDIQQLHVWTDSWIDCDEWKRAVVRLKQEGKIRFFGVSVNDYEPESVLKLVASGLIDTIQVIYNLFEQAPADKLFPLCEKHHVGVIVRVPFDEGSLTGTFTEKTLFPKGDFRRAFFGNGRLQEVLSRVERLKEDLPSEDQDPLSQAALKFCLSHPAVSRVIPGMRRPEHVLKNLAVSGKGIYSAEQLALLKKHIWQRNFYQFWL